MSRATPMMVVDLGRGTHERDADASWNGHRIHREFREVTFAMARDGMSDHVADTGAEDHVLR